MPLPVPIKILDSRYLDYWGVPYYGKAGDAAIDLRAAISNVVIIEPGNQEIIGTGLAIYIKNPDYAGIVIPRSSWGTRGLVLGNTVGLIDSNYQGEIMIAAWNRSKLEISICPGDRIAQLMVIPVARVEFELVDKFYESERGDKGFGSTGR